MSEGQKNNFEYLKLESHHFWYNFVLTEGRNQQIRKICQEVGNRVVRLVRTRHGDYGLTQELYDKKILSR